MDHNGPGRPKYDSRIEQRYASLLDTVLKLIGAAPDSINVAPYWNTRGVTRGKVVSVRNPDDEEALLHELGHFWSMQQQGASRELADSTHFDPYSQGGAERLANTFAGVMRDRTARSLGPTRRNDVELLQRILGRLAASDPNSSAQPDKSSLSKFVKARSK